MMLNGKEKVFQETINGYIISLIVYSDDDNNHEIGFCIIDTNREKEPNVQGYITSKNPDEIRNTLRSSSNQFLLGRVHFKYIADEGWFITTTEKLLQEYQVMLPRLPFMRVMQRLYDKVYEEIKPIDTYTQISIDLRNLDMLKSELAEIREEGDRIRQECSIGKLCEQCYYSPETCNNKSYELDKYLNELNGEGNFYFREVNVIESIRKCVHRLEKLGITVDLDNVILEPCFPYYHLTKQTYIQK